MLLLPRHGIFYTPSHDVDNARFVRVWRSTWARLPLWTRRRLLAYWRTLPLYAEGFSPSFFCARGAITSKGEDTNAIGRWKPFDGSTTYLADVVDIMPDEILATLIAHELAHVLYRLQLKQWEPEAFCSKSGLGMLSFKDPDREPPPNLEVWNDDEEMDVRDLQDQWGFSEDDFCQWLRENQEQINALKAAYQSEIDTLENEQQENTQ